ncbi:MAG: hypothetical protein BWK80_30790 [Desulfobacteraceae bacterium IS3]|nr:MAG: hypothetical protein BWK80_30790 [Desulfobacteraceae bacterium IS3]
MDTGEHIPKWLECQETQEILLSVARSVMRYARSKNLSLAFIGKETWQDVAPDVLTADIRSELIVFILENKVQLQKILTPGNKNCHHFLRKSFINRWIENTRKPFTDFYRYLYKRTADALRVSDDFHTSVRNRTTLFFSLSNEAVCIPPLSLEDMGDITFPSHIVEKPEYDEINKNRILLALAAYFLTQVSKMWGDKPVCAEVRDFIHWIGSYVPLHQPIPVKMLPGGKDALEFAPDDRSIADKIYFDPAMIKKWAQIFVNRLNEREKAAFFLRHGRCLSLKEIAQKLGYKGSSGPKYPLEQAEHKLKFFLSDLPWLSPDDLNEEAFALFRDTLLLILEKDLTCSDVP